MDSAIGDRVVAGAVESIDAGFDVLLADGWVPEGCEEAMVRVREFERLGRRLHAARLGLQERIGRSGVYKADGHGSAKVMVRHGANLSNAEALRRDQVVRMGREMPCVAEALAAGRLGVPQAERIARTFANRRVRDQLIAVDAQMTRVAVMLPYPEFDAALADWERLSDEDGAADRAERADANRDFTMPRNVDGTGRFDGGGGGVRMQAIEDVWQRQVQREFEADWAEARRVLGDAATTDDLARTPGQRRFDAMETCMVRGDLATYGVTARTCTDLVIDEVTFERHLANLFGTDPGPDPRLATWWDDLCDTLGPDNPGPDGEQPDADDAVDVEEPDAHRCGEVDLKPASPSSGTGDLVGYRCGTVDGRPLDPTEVVVATLIGQVRRTVTRADGVIMDMGRKDRCFTGARQLAVRLAHRSCTWTACGVPSSQCQCDHLDAFNGPEHGRTCPDNGAPTCGKHNRLKEQGFTIVRDARGRYHVFRPDGTEIT